MGLGLQPQVLKRKVLTVPLDLQRTASSCQLRTYHQPPSGLLPLSVTPAGTKRSQKKPQEVAIRLFRQMIDITSPKQRGSWGKRRRSKFVLRPRGLLLAGQASTLRPESFRREFQAVVRRFEKSPKPGNVLLYVPRADSRPMGPTPPVVRQFANPLTFRVGPTNLRQMFDLRLPTHPPERRWARSGLATLIQTTARESRGAERRAIQNDQMLSRRFNLTLDAVGLGGLSPNARWYAKVFRRKPGGDSIFTVPDKYLDRAAIETPHRRQSRYLLNEA